MHTPLSPYWSEHSVTHATKWSYARLTASRSSSVKLTLGERRPANHASYCHAGKRRGPTFFPKQHTQPRLSPLFADSAVSSRTTEKHWSAHRHRQLVYKRQSALSRTRTHRYTATNLPSAAIMMSMLLTIFKSSTDQSNCRVPIAMQNGSAAPSSGLHAVVCPTCCGGGGETPVQVPH